ncbi:MAG: hypothetical protein JRF33_22195 [Deltaproteobacteria bacterium]|nr:hypothetical protein [Deltaproteobacteria bacterium]
MKRCIAQGTLLAWTVMVLCVACSGSGAGTVDAGLDAEEDGGGDLGADSGSCLPVLTPTEEDRDGDGVPDEKEDRNDNGVVDPGESDPDDPDSDDDCLHDGIEDGNLNGQVDWGETDPRSADTDGDGLSDGVEDFNRNGQLDEGESDPLKVDSDHDGLPDGLEDTNANGIVDPGETDPALADTDGDGLSDGVEDRNANGVVDAGETDPTNPDMDGDGVVDGDEDRDGDGRLGDCDQPCSNDLNCASDEVCAINLGVCYSPNCAKGETDPYDVDTDRDGVGDGQEASTLVCAADRLKAIELLASEQADSRLALEVFFDQQSRLSAGVIEVGASFFDEQSQVAGFLLSRSGDAGSAVQQEAVDRAAYSVFATLTAANSRALVTFDGHEAVVAEYDLSLAVPLSPTALAAELLNRMNGSALDGHLAPAGSQQSAYRLTTETVYRSGTRALVVGALSSIALLDEEQTIRLADVTNATALAGYTDQLDVQCESFASVGVNPVDIIWVVDNSESMGEEQVAVAAAADVMAALLGTTTLDWRVAVTITDLANWGGDLWSGFVTDMETFKDDVRQGVNGSPREQSLQAGLNAIDFALPCTPAGQNPSRYQLRCDAIRIVIILSDEDDEDIEDASDGDDYAGAPDAAKVAEFVDGYRQRNVTLFAIVGGEPKCPTALNSSKGINAVVNQVGGGSVGSICDHDQSANMQNIVRAAFGVSSPYRLAESPVSATIKVAQVKQAGQQPVEVPRSRSDGFDYDGVSNSILFYGFFRPTQDGLDVVASYRSFTDCQPAPGGEECNGLDDDCDGLTDEDFDGDSDGWSVCGGDCDDTDPQVHPDAVEICNGVDDDCDGDTDEGFDSDGDGFRTCDDDCDDEDETIFPGAPEKCDGKDNDCDGEIDPEWACG